MQIHDVPTLAASLAVLDLSKAPSHEEAMAATLELGRFRGNQLALARFSGRPPWEKHAAQELLYVLMGELELTLRTEEGSSVHELSPGSLFLVPPGVWHRSFASPSVALLFCTPDEGNESFHGEDPLAAKGA